MRIQVVWVFASRCARCSVGSALAGTMSGVGGIATLPGTIEYALFNDHPGDEERVAAAM